jgi:hypothetical protein
MTDAFAIAIDSTSTDDERTEAINSFAEAIRNMSGERIFAIAVACDRSLRPEYRQTALYCGSVRRDDGSAVMLCT